MHIDIASFLLGFLIGWVFKVAASTISFSFFGRQHDDSSTVSAVTSHLQGIRENVNDELDVLMRHVNAFKSANETSTLTREEVDELCDLFVASRDKLKDF
tara:strand:+ start:1941 stop:2240 length:300 start_codon:yes stop_codon:yes gene_type:complete